MSRSIQIVFPGSTDTTIPFPRFLYTIFQKVRIVREASALNIGM